MGSYVISITAILISLGSLYISYSLNRRNIDISVKPPLFLWQTDYFYDMHEAGIILKWVRIINRSAQPISIYEIEVKSVVGRVLCSHQGLEIDLKFIKKEIINDDRVTSHILKPVITLPPFTAVEGYIFLSGVYLKLDDLIKEDQDYTLILKTSRKLVNSTFRFDFTERDI